MMHSKVLKIEMPLSMDTTVFIIFDGGPLTEDQFARLHAIVDQIQSSVLGSSPARRAENVEKARPKDDDKSPARFTRWIRELRRERDEEIMQKVSVGVSNCEIGRQYDLSPHTIAAIREKNDDEQVAEESLVQ